MKILVTGAAGFIGSHLVDALLRLRHEVVGLDNFNDSYDPKIKEKNLNAGLAHSNFSFIRGDILDEASLDVAFRRDGFEVVVHLAARAGVRPSIESPLDYYRNNVEGTLRLLEYCKTYDVKNFILASSSSVYGNNKRVPFSEQDNVDCPISPYAASKKACELISYNYHFLYDLNVFALRFFTVYGPRQRPDMAIHKFAKLITEGKPVPVYGEGKLRRDFTYIDDIIQGILSSMSVVRGFEVINLGESKVTTVLRLLQLMEEHLGKKAIIKMLPLQPGDVNETYADISKACSLINYRPQIRIETGIQQFLDWYLMENHIRA